ncbi:MAG: hypothetical protein QXU46_00985 [Candidatus Bathyarchaeia archaeon]
MKIKMAIILMIVFLIVAASGKACFAVDGQLPSELPSEVTEIVQISVNCTRAHVMVDSLVLSANETLVHFPTEINMTADEWENVTAVMAVFSTSDSFLFYVFNNTSEDNAESIANTLTTQLNTVFGTDFNYNSTGLTNGYVNVTYTGSGVGNLTQFTASLMQDCLASDLGGFSSTFIPMTRETNAHTGIVGLKESGGFNWTYSMGVSYFTNIPIGVGMHTIDILDLLNVNSLAPSSYAVASLYPSYVYTSIVQLSIVSNSTISYSSCQPGTANPPTQLRGWYIQTQINPTILMAYFSFGGDPSSVTALSFTFSGVVIPEFTVPALITVLASTAILTWSIKKLSKRK